LLPLRNSATSSPPSSFSFYPHGAHRPLHSFPTRRSSDLTQGRRSYVAQFGAIQGDRAHVLGPQSDQQLHQCGFPASGGAYDRRGDRKSTRLNSSHVSISYAVFCLKKKKR